MTQKLPITALVSFDAMLKLTEMNVQLFFPILGRVKSELILRHILSVVYISIHVQSQNLMVYTHTHSLISMLDWFSNSI